MPEEPAWTDIPKCAAWHTGQELDMAHDWVVTCAVAQRVDDVVPVGPGFDKAIQLGGLNMKTGVTYRVCVLPQASIYFGWRSKF